MENNTVDYAYKLHAEFIETMHPYFGISLPTYVDNIQFRPLLTSGGYGRGPIIYINDAYLRDFDKNPRDIFGRYNLDTTIYHESAHHLHFEYHAEAFEDVWTLELIIECAVAGYLRKNNLSGHIGNLEGSEQVGLELYDKLDCESEFMRLLQSDEDESFFIYEKILGKNHEYLKDRELEMKKLEEEDY